ncbi:MAG: polyhydroxyalkanoate synthesis repressor PhaR [Thiolinea sp.]
MSDILTIKKYPNRRLYDPRQSRYITLSDVRELVIREVPFQVIDRQSGENITNSILLQIIVEQETGNEPLFNSNVLTQFIRSHHASARTSFASFLEQSLEHFNAQRISGKQA